MWRLRKTKKNLQKNERKNKRNGNRKVKNLKKVKGHGPCWLRQDTATMALQFPSPEEKRTIKEQALRRLSLGVIPCRTTGIYVLMKDPVGALPGTCSYPDSLTTTVTLFGGSPPNRTPIAPGMRMVRMFS